MNVQNNPDEISQREILIRQGQQLHEKKPQAVLELNHEGCFVAVEMKTKRYFLGNTVAEVLVTAHEAMPESRFHVKRIRDDFIHKLGGKSFSRN